jgi:hypothetical protein
MMWAHHVEPLPATIGRAYLVGTQILAKHPLRDEAATLVPDWHFGGTPGVTILFRKRDRVADGL